MPQASPDDNLDKIDCWEDNGYSTNSLNKPYRFDHLHKSERSVEQDKSAEDTNSSNNPYRFDHLHKSESSVEQEESAENLKNN
jgi:hypothetical protein